ncbi:MAG TPA: ADP-glyceromanno-heptose 6-epimerase [Bacteroidales bacterium]|nr:ADP-glyceromanno-heptose 6-epimerase [Bacteroidales bacterium]HPS18329.1 ADP-glyceromanno-heptose 6-epimerase [Bacteroidales bacterium]
MIVITGAAGFIGSCLLNKLNNKGHSNIVIVDDFLNPVKNKNILNKAYIGQVHRNDFFSWLDGNYKNVSFVYHIGARTDTTEFDHHIFDELNLNYSKKMWLACTKYRLPLIYASSAATYGAGENGYKDDHDIIFKLKPLNPYGESKNDFDKWVLSQTDTPPYWSGLKFFNVFGPNEYHKSRMASVIFHSYNQIKSTGKVKLFRSHKPEFRDGEQLRDFIYVKDIVNILWIGMYYKQNSGIYNLGTGKARSFLDLARAVFKALHIPEDIEFIDIPEDIRDKYQYYTQADMSKMRSLGFDIPFYSLEDAVTDYVQGYLMHGLYY